MSELSFTEIPIDLTQYLSLLRVKQEEGKVFLFDPLRKKWLLRQPEEFVRQLFIQYLLTEKGYNANRIKVEKHLVFNKLSKRCDLLVYDRNIRPWLMVECKAPKVKIDDKVFHQVVTYNFELKVDYFVMTNGMQTICAKIDYDLGSYVLLSDIPSMESIDSQ